MSRNTLFVFATLLVVWCSVAFAAPALAQSTTEAPGVWAPESPAAPPAVPDVSLYAQLGAGVLLRERNDVLEPTFTQRVTFGLTLGGCLRVGAVFLYPMFIESYTQPLPGATPSNRSNTGSYFGGVEVAGRFRLDRLALHAGANVTLGAGEYYIATPTGSALIWPVAFFSSVFVAAGVAVVDNWDILVRMDAGVRAREVGPTDFIAQASLALDWH